MGGSKKTKLMLYSTQLKLKLSLAIIDIYWNGEKKLIVQIVKKEILRIENYNVYNIWTILHG